MARRTLTDSERAERADKVTRLAAAAKAIEEGAGFDLDQAVAILSGYSRRNVALILVQAAERGRDCPQAVAGFHDWRKAGRVVRKGSTGYLIFRPRMVKDKATGEDTRTGFAITYVFDVADTDPVTDTAPATLAAALAD